MQRRTITAYASSKITSEYADSDVWIAPIPAIPRSEFGKYFCSQLVAESIRSGVGAADKIGRLRRQLPGWFTNSGREVDPSEVLTSKHLPSAALNFTPAFLDGPNPSSPAEAEAALKQSVCENASKAFADKGITVTTYHAALEGLITLWQANDPRAKTLDQVLASSIQASGLLALSGRRYPPDSDSFFIDMYIRNSIVFGEATSESLTRTALFYDAELALMAKTNLERDADVTALKKVYLSSGLESIRLHLALTWDALLVGRRIELATQRAKEIIMIQLGME